jgi:hypothetical protein
MLLACVLWTGVISAMEDPTRPPAGFYNSGRAAAASGEEGPVLQSVLISESERLAIISGELVAIGGKVAGGRLVKVSETEVVLQQGTARKTLKLYPGVDKREPGTTRSAHAGGKR